MISHYVAHVPNIVITADTHKDEHVAVAIDKLSARIGQLTLPINNMGYIALERQARALGKIEVFGVEVTGSYGAGLTHFWRDQVYTVIEVNCPDQSTKHSLGKSDLIDAEMATRAVLSGLAQDQTKSGVDEVEMIRMLKRAKDSATKSRTQSINQMKALIITAPVGLWAALRGLTSNQLVARCVGWRCGKMGTPTNAANYTLRSLAQRHTQLAAEIKALNKELA